MTPSPHLSHIIEAKIHVINNKIFRLKPDVMKSLILQASLILSSEFLAYSPGTRFGVQVPYPMMWQLRNKISKEKALYFPERIIEGQP